MKVQLFGLGDGARPVLLDERGVDPIEIRHLDGDGSLLGGVCLWVCQTLASRYGAFGVPFALALDDVVLNDCRIVKRRGSFEALFIYSTRPPEAEPVEAVTVG
jgi:hypothetical protein